MGIVRRRHQSIQERCAFVLALADREQLLELVDRHHESLPRRDAIEHRGQQAVTECPRQVRERALTGAHEHLSPGPAAAREPTRAQRREHARAQNRSFADPRRAQDAHDARLRRERQ